MIKFIKLNITNYSMVTERQIQMDENQVLEIIATNKKAIEELDRLNKIYNANVLEIVRLQVQNKDIALEQCRLRTHIRVVRIKIERRMTEEEKREYLSRHPFCMRCNTDDDLTIHHKIKLCDGGNNDEANLETLCVKCHRKEHPISDEMAIKNGEILK